MPTHEEFAQFKREFDQLSEANQDRFVVSMKQMVADLRAGIPFRAGLRVKGVQGYSSIFEMTWAPDGRATFEFGPAVRAGDTHIVWRRIGGHDILKNP